jgi:hypothetical protein
VPTSPPTHPPSTRLATHQPSPWRPPFHHSHRTSAHHPTSRSSRRRPTRHRPAGRRPPTVLIWEPSVLEGRVRQPLEPSLEGLPLAVDASGDEHVDIRRVVMLIGAGRNRRTACSAGALPRV